MAKTKIEWCDYTENPIKGLCPMGCSYCYARALYKRFGWNPELRYVAPAFTIANIEKIKKPSRIFWCSTMELFHNDIADLIREDIFKIVRMFPQHTHIFLTKQPQNLIKWSPFPENCWVGVSATDRSMYHFAEQRLSDVEAKVKFISFEPLLGQIESNVDWYNGTYLHTTLKTAGINWLIIGQQTPVKPATQPKLEWIKEIVEAADKVKVPVFLKYNLYPVFAHPNGYPNSFQVPKWAHANHGINMLRQEFPHVQS